MGSTAHSLTPSEKLAERAALLGLCEIVHLLLFVINPVLRCYHFCLHKHAVPFGRSVALGARGIRQRVSMGFLCRKKDGPAGDESSLSLFLGKVFVLPLIFEFLFTGYRIVS